MKRTCILICMICAALSAPNATAGLVTYEGFDYSNDDDVLHNENDGFGWDVPWNDTDGDFHHLSQDDTSLGPSATPFPIKGDHLVGTIGGEATRVFSNPINMSQDGNVLYASLLMRKDAVAATSSDNIEFILGVNGGTTIRFGMTSLEQFFLANSNLPFGTVVEDKVYMLILKVTSNAATPDMVQGLVYGENDEVPLIEPAVWHVTNSTTINTGDTLNSVRLILGNNADGAFDEIRLGDSWYGVAIPEPTSISLIVLGVSTLVGIRRWGR